MKIKGTHVCLITCRTRAGECARCWGGWGWILVGLIFFHVVAAAGVFAQPPLTARELMEFPLLKEHRQALEEGKIVPVSRREDVADSELNVAMAIMILASLDHTLAELQRQFTGKHTPDIMEFQEILDVPASLQQATAFESVSFDPSEAAEAHALLKAKPGKDYNLSTEEIALFRQAAKEMSADANEREVATATMKAVLYQRYLSYRRHGLQGIPGYQIGRNKQVDPASELIAATESMPLLKGRYPDYYHSLRFYPDEGASPTVNRFFWVKQMENSRPIFVLKHWFLDIQPEYGLITERRYYLSHSLNSMQVVIGCLPYEEHTLVVLLNRVFTEQIKVTIGKRIAKRVGRSIVEKKMRSLFENLRAAF